jgi:hypothetical protein
VGIHGKKLERMLSEPLPDTPSSDINVEPRSRLGESGPSGTAELPGELSEFNQRLASFGLGEAPDPLLTDARPPVKRRSRS